MSLAKVVMLVTMVNLVLRSVLSLVITKDATLYQANAYLVWKDTIAILTKSVSLAQLIVQFAVLRNTALSAKVDSEAMCVMMCALIVNHIPAAIKIPDIVLRTAVKV